MIVVVILPHADVGDLTAVTLGVSVSMVPAAGVWLRQKNAILRNMAVASMYTLAQLWPS